MFTCTSLCWKYVSSRTENAPERYSAFRNQNCLTIQRLGEDTEWNEVVEAVKPVRVQKGYGIIIPGYNYGRRRPGEPEI